MQSYYTTTGTHLCNLGEGVQPAIYLARGSNLTTHIPLYQLYTILSLFSGIDEIVNESGERITLHQFIELFNSYCEGRYTTFVI